jgi:hypothetical protein
MENMFIVTLNHFFIQIICVIYEKKALVVLFHVVYSKIVRLNP